tara:strand:- start:27 stop:434 length:408 start_codon:yes stop_codon:yes gene_type:complete
MANFIVYNSVTGQILRKGKAPFNDVEAQAWEQDTSAVELYCADDSTQYINITSDPLSVEDKTIITYTIDVTAIDADGVDVATITDLPDGCIATVNSESEQETEGVIVFGTDLAGVYQILLTHPLALDTILEVTAA